MANRPISVGIERHAVVKLEQAEGRARRAEYRIDPDGADHQAGKAGDQAVKQILGRDRGDQRQSEHDHDHHLDAAEIQPDLGEHRQQRHGGDGGDQPPKAEAAKQSTSACCAWPFLVIG